MNKSEPPKIYKLPHLHNYNLINKIGTGLTAQVFQAHHEKHGRVSVKIIEPSFSSSPIGSMLIKNEISILKSVKHKNILGFIEAVQNKDKICIVTEFCEGGDLESFIKKKRVITERKAIEYLAKIIDGCIYLREMKVIHRDLKPSNIFLRNGEPLIADFGFSVIDSDTQSLKYNAGSPLYMPHESLVSKEFSEKSDVFALGVTMFELLCGKTPWSARSEKELSEKLRSAPSIPNTISCDVKRLILDCLAFESKNRPCFEEIKKRLKQIEASVLQKKNSNETNVAKVEKSFSFNLGSEVKNNQAMSNKENVKTFYDKKEKSFTLMTGRKEKSKKKESVSIKPKENEKIEGGFLKNLNPKEFTFLPSYLIVKFQCIVEQYKKILGLEEGQWPYPKSETDRLISDIQECKTEKELCQTIEGFIRRLFRLTKNYKEYHGCLTNLEKLYNRVNTVVI